MDPVTTPAAGVDPAVAAPVKPGYKTTEFWLSAAGTIVGLLIGSGIIPTTGTWPQIVGLVTGLLSAFGYTVVRAQVKAGNQ